MAPAMTDGDRLRGTYRDALASREFRALFAAYTISLLGSAVSTVALTVLVYERTRSPFLSSLAFALAADSPRPASVSPPLPGSRPARPEALPRPRSRDRSHPSVMRHGPGVAAGAPGAGCGGLRVEAGPDDLDRLERAAAGCYVLTCRST